MPLKHFIVREHFPAKSFIFAISFVVAVRPSLLTSLLWDYVNKHGKFRYYITFPGKNRKRIHFLYMCFPCCDFLHLAVVIELSSQLGKFPHKFPQRSAPFFMGHV